MKSPILFISLLLMALAAAAQPAVTDSVRTNDGYWIGGRVIDGDTVPHINLHMVTVMPPFVFKSARQQQRYTRLVRYVKKVYPYSLLIKNKLREISTQLDTIDGERNRKAFIKQKERELRQDFEGQLRTLTILQGRILLKMVDRETGGTTYHWLRELKGPITAVVWQSVAKIFGNDLKKEYDKDGDDAMIEDIIVRIENGSL